VEYFVYWIFRTRLASHIMNILMRTWQFMSFSVDCLGLTGKAEGEKGVKFAREASEWLWNSATIVDG
jgi:hypothetical protein